MANYELLVARFRHLTQNDRGRVTGARRYSKGDIISGDVLGDDVFRLLQAGAIREVGGETPQETQPEPKDPTGAGVGSGAPTGGVNDTTGERSGDQGDGSGDGGGTPEEKGQDTPVFDPDIAEYPDLVKFAEENGLLTDPEASRKKKDLIPAIKQFQANNA